MSSLCGISCFPPGSGGKYPCDLNDTAWFERIDASGGTVLRRECSYYFLKEQVKTLVRAMADAFQGGVLVFDAANEKAVKLMLKTWLKDAEIEDVGILCRFGRNEIGATGQRFAGLQPGLYAGLQRSERPVQSAAFSAFLQGVGDGVMNMQIVKIKFRGKAMKHRALINRNRRLLRRVQACTGGCRLQSCDDW